MPRKPTGTVEKHRGKWTARLRWSDSKCASCSHDRVAHPPPPPRRCEICGCSAFSATRREWRRIAEPNRRDVAGEDLRAKLREIGGDSPRGDDETRVVLDGMTFGEVASRYELAHVCEPVYENGVKIRGMQDHTGVRSIIDKILVPALGARLLTQITRPELEDLRNARLSAPKLRGGKKVVETKGRRSIARVNREMATLRAVLNYGVDLGAIARNPMNAGGRQNSLVLLAAERPRDRVLSPAEEKRILRAYGRPELHRSVDYFIVALDTGMRAKEMFGLTAADVDFRSRVLRLPWEITKTKRPRIVPLSRRVHSILERRAKARKPHARIFDDLSPTAVREDFIAAKTDAKIEDFRMHDCRATIATRLLQSGLSEAEIAMMTGHRFQRQQGGAESSRVPRKHYLRLTDETLTRATAAIDSGRPN